MLPARGGGERAGASHRRPASALAAPRRPLIAAAVRSASSALRSWSRSISAPAGHGQRRRRGGRPLALGRRRPALPGPGQDGAQEVLAREGDEQRTAEVAQLAEAAQDLEVVVDREVEVEPRVERDLLLGDARPQRRLDPLREPALQVVDGSAWPARLAVDPGRALDVHEHVAAAALGHQVEHLGVGAARDVVDRRRARVERPARDLGLRRCRRSPAHPTAATSPSTAGTSRAASSSACDRRAAAGRHRADVEQVEARLDQGQPVGDRRARRTAAGALEERVVGDVDDPGRQRGREVEHVDRRGAIGSSAPNVARLRLVPLPAVALRCVYTDLDGTLLGSRGSLFRDAEGNFSLLQARALEACHRAGVEVVIMSGRREAQVMADARLLGQTSYIYEAGCGVVIDGERTLLTGDWLPDEDGTPAERMLAARESRTCSSTAFRTGSSGTTLARDRVLSHPLPRQGRRRRGERACSPSTATRTCASSTTARSRRPMEGLDGPAHAYHLVPGGASKAKAVAFHMRARGYAPEECIGIGDSLEDLDVAAPWGASSWSPTGPNVIRGCARRSPRVANVTVTEGRTATASTRRWSPPWRGERRGGRAGGQPARVNSSQCLDGVYVGPSRGAFHADLAGRVARQVGVEAARGDLGGLVAGRGLRQLGVKEAAIPPANPQRPAEGGTNTSSASAPARVASRRSIPR